MLRTNFYDSKLNIYRKAIDEFKKQTGSNRLFINDRAYDIGGNTVRDCSALHDAEDDDLSEFWRIFDEIEKTLKLNNMKMTIKTKKKVEMCDQLIHNHKYDLLGILQNNYTGSGFSIVIHIDGMPTCFDIAFFRMNSIKIK